MENYKEEIQKLGAKLFSESEIEAAANRQTIAKTVEHYAKNAPTWVKDKDNRLIHIEKCTKDILNDKELQLLNLERAKIYALARLTLLVKSSGEVEFFYATDTQYLLNLEKLINHRTKSIKDYYGISSIETNDGK